MKNNFYTLYKILNSPIVLFLRITVFVVLTLILYINLHNPDILLRLLFLEFVVVVNELFIFEKINKTTPKEKVVHTKNSIDCLDFSIKRLFENHEMVHIVEAVSKNSAAMLFQKKIGMQIPMNESGSIDKKELLDELQSIVLSVKGNYIHHVDVCAAIFIILNKKQKILQEYELSNTDILYILYWVRRELGIDKKAEQGIAFSGSGVFDFFVYGWSEQVKKYSENFTEHVIREFSPDIIGRNREYDLLVTALSKNSVSNALIVGHPGTGVTTLVSLLTYESNRAAVPEGLSHKMVFKLLADRLLAGVQNQSELEDRFTSLFAEIEHSGNIIIYVPYIENIFGGGGFDFDISGSLFDYLKSNKIKIIGSTTPEAYKQFIEPKTSLHEFFDVVTVDEPDLETTMYMLFEVIEKIEHINHVVITYDGVKESVSLSSSYLPEGHFPSKAIILLEDAVAASKIHGKTVITKHEVRSLVESKTHILLENPNQNEKEKLLHMEEGLHKHVIAQEEAVGAIAGALRRVRSGMKNDNHPLCSFLFLGPTGVGKTECAKALAREYFGSEDAMIRLDMSEYQTQDSIHKILGDGQTNSFIEQVSQNPFSLILLDEFEKAHPQILDVFLQVLDDARMTSDNGKTVTFKNNIIIATANAGSEFIREQLNAGTSNEELKNILVEDLMKKERFKPELLNRFDDVIVFKPLTENDTKKVSRKMLDALTKELEEKQLSIAFDDTVVDWVATTSFDDDFGARNIKRFIAHNIENVLSEKILDGSLDKFANNVVRIGENNTLTIATA